MVKNSIVQALSILLFNVKFVLYGVVSSYHITWITNNKYFFSAFDNVANAAMHMFVLMSTENYPVCM